MAFLIRSRKKGWGQSSGQPQHIAQHPGRDPGWARERQRARSSKVAVVIPKCLNARLVLSGIRGRCKVHLLSSQEN